MVGTVRLPPDSTGKIIDTSELTVSATTVERQNIVLADPVDAAGLADVNAKGLQGTYGLQVQDFKDSGRTPISFNIDNVANVVSEGMRTMAVIKGTVSSSTASYTVTAGKTLRITSMTVMILATGAILGTVRARLRYSTGTVATSDALAINLLASVPATSGQAYGQTVSVSDGFEIPAGDTVGISTVGGATTSNMTVTVTGFEY